MIDPIKIFAQWFDEAAQNKTFDHTAMVVATASKDGKPSARVTLLKAFDEKGFVFYTNMESRKSSELKNNPHASLCFYWAALGKQVRIEGAVHKVSDEEADAYYNGRPLISRIGAWASAQSRPLESRKVFMEKVHTLQETYSENNPPPRPPYWGGWRVVPEVIEFWQDGEFRLHDRDVYTRDGKGWNLQKLYP